MNCSARGCLFTTMLTLSALLSGCIANAPEDATVSLMGSSKPYPIDAVRGKYVFSLINRQKFVRGGRGLEADVRRVEAAVYSIDSVNVKVYHEGDSFLNEVPYHGENFTLESVNLHTLEVIHKKLAEFNLEHTDLCEDEHPLRYFAEVPDNIVKSMRREAIQDAVNEADSLAAMLGVNFRFHDLSAYEILLRSDGGLYVDDNEGSPVNPVLFIIRQQVGFNQ